MMYCTANTPWQRTLRTHVANGLGLWHTFKMAHFLIYRHFANAFFAPLFHHFAPGHRFFVHPSRLIQVQEWFTLMRMAYDKEIHAELKRARERKDVNKYSRQILKNLQDLCRFFIPVVSL